MISKPSLKGVGKHLYQFFSKEEIDAFCAPPGKEKYRSSFTSKLDDFDLLHDIFHGKVNFSFSFSFCFFEELILTFDYSMRKGNNCVLLFQKVRLMTTRVATVIAMMMEAVVVMIIVATMMVIVVTTRR